MSSVISFVSSGELVRHPNNISFPPSILHISPESFLVIKADWKKCRIFFYVSKLYFGEGVGWEHERWMSIRKNVHWIFQISIHDDDILYYMTMMMQVRVVYRELMPLQTTIFPNNLSIKCEWNNFVSHWHMMLVQTILILTANLVKCANWRWYFSDVWNQHEMERKSILPSESRKKLKDDCKRVISYGNESNQVSNQLNFQLAPTPISKW